MCAFLEIKEIISTMFIRFLSSGKIYKILDTERKFTAAGVELITLENCVITIVATP